MRDEIFGEQVAERVLQVHQLNKDVVFGIEGGSGHRRFEIERQPFLHALHAGALSEIEEKSQIQNNGRSQDRITAEEVNLDLHLVAEPTKNIDVVPAFFVIAARRIVVDAHNVRKILVELWIDVRLQDVFEHREF